MAGKIRYIPGRDTLVGGKYRPIGGGAPEDAPGTDWSQMDSDQLQTELESTIAQFDEVSGQDTISEADLQTMRDLTAKIEDIRGEQGVRREAAEKAQQEIEEMAARVRGQAEEATDETEEEESTEEDTEDSEDEEEAPEVVTTEEVTAEEEAPVQIAASASKAKSLNLSAVRSRQKKVHAPKPTRKTVSITAAADVPGIDTGMELDMDSLTEAVSGRAHGIKTKSGKRAKALVASYRLPFEDRLVVNNDGNAAEGTAALVAASDQSKLPGGDLTASGGWCAPSETVYDIASVACPDMLWSPPEIQLRRGGIRYIPTPTLDVEDLAHIWTEEDDIADAETKECFHVPCPDFLDVRCDAVYACIEAGILTERAFPELVGWYTRNALVAHEIVVKRRAFLAAVNHSLTQEITVAETMGAFTAVFGAVALQAADLTEKHSLCENIAIEVTFPWWSRNLFLTDVARQNGRSIEEVDPMVIARAFGRIGVSVSFARGLTPDVPTNIGGATAPLGWPSSIPFLIHPTGAFQIGRGDVVDLGVIQDSAKFSHNDYTALFTEECVALVARGPEARFVTVPVCADGTTGGQAATLAAIDCTSPVDGGEAEGS